MPPQLLALYGSLRRGEDSYRKLALDRRLRFLTPCVVPGRLFDLGLYPALIAGAGLVHAELFEPADASILAELDAFEGYDPADPAGSSYVREAVTLAGSPHQVFVYRYNPSVEGHPEIASGDWVAYRTARDAVA
jgi:gamma-glutamylcyclotransferase (GGCT)/AIG2-like uncharacterized protein YtfP